MSVKSQGHRQILIVALSILQSTVNADTAAICTNSPRLSVPTECEKTGSDKMCKTFFYIYVIASLLLIAILVAVWQIKRQLSDRSTILQKDMDDNATFTQNIGTGQTDYSDEETEGRGRSHLSQKSDELQASCSSEEKNVVMRPGLQSLCNRESENARRSFYVPMMLLVLFCLLSRVVFLVVVFLPDDEDFEYNLLTDNIITVAKFLTVIYYCKFKTHFYYFITRRQAPIWLNWLFVTLQVLSVVICLQVTAVLCSSLSGTPFLLAETVPQGSLDIFLIAFSLYTYILVYRKLGFGIFKEQRLWFTVTECLMQVNIIGRILILICHYNIDHMEDQTWLVIYTLYFLVTELVPFCYLVFAMLQKIAHRINYIRCLKRDF